MALSVRKKDPSGQWSNQSHYDYGFRIYNPTIGKFLSVDPLAKSYPWYTPYQFAGNNPIKFIDLDGLEEYDPQKDAFFSARLLLTTFYDIKHSAENLILNTFVPADPGMKWQATYKVNSKGDEIFETVIRQIPQQGAVKETVNTALDIVNVAFAGKLDPSDFVSVRTGGNTQFTRGVRNFLEDIDNKSFKNSFQDGEYLIGTTNVDITVFQVHNKRKGGGSFFTTAKPRNAIEAEDMLNIRMYDNFAEEVTSYTIKKGTEFSYRKVSGGSGNQIFIPKHLQKSDHIIKGKTEPLPTN